MRYSASLVVALAALVTGRQPGASMVHIATDGDFDDWKDVPVAVSDPAGDSNGAIDLREVRVTADGRFVALLVDVGHEVNVQAMAGTMSLAIDADDDRGTGATVQGLEGTDLEVQFSAPPRNGEVVTRYAAGQPARTESGDGINLCIAPLVASDRFETRMDRAGLPRGSRLRLKLAYSEGGEVRDETTPMTLPLPAFESDRAPEPDLRIPTVDPLARAATATFRVVVWNVQGLEDDQPRFARIFRALDADVLMLDEVFRSAGAASRNWLPTRDPHQLPWEVRYGDANQTNLVVARGPATKVIDVVPYPPGTLEAMGARASAEDRWSSEVVDEDAVGVFGVTVTMAGRRMLAVPLHLTCCSNSVTSENEAWRVIDAQAIQSAVRAARTRTHPDALLVGGDVNLISTRTPLEIVRRIDDMDGMPLATVQALQLDGLSNATFPSHASKSQFRPIRVDWLTYSSSSLELVHAFVFDSSDLSPYWLREHGLQADDSGKASDHLPIVADFRWKGEAR